MKPARADRRFTIAETADRIRDALARADESTAWVAVRDFLDDYRAVALDARPSLLAEPPRLVDPRFDAYLAAFAEHFAVHDGLRVPAWTQEPERFLDTWWFPTQFLSLH